VKKKHEPELRQLVDRIEHVRMQCPRHSAAALCRSVGLPYSTLRRWRERRRRSSIIWRQPGPSKQSALPVADFRSRVAHLNHGTTRTHGTGLLISAFRESVSRRLLRALIARLRRRRLRRLRNAKRHVTWHLPNLAWAIDALHLQTSTADPGVVVVLARDLASHFHFEPLVLKAESAEQNLHWLRRLCSRHGPPLLLKRDNGAPFNAAILDNFIAEKGILPLNSPVRHPSYNGAIEHGVGSFKRAVYAALAPDRPVPEIPRLLPLIRAIIHLHNTRPRRSLAGLTPAQAYFHHQTQRWSLANRHEIFDWICAKAQSMLETKWEMSDHHTRAVAWRRSVVAWLRCQQLITISQKPQPSPHFTTQIRS
jgi:transposase InsO family protein